MPVKVSSEEKDGACRGSDPYHCVECGKTFLVLSRYKTHMMAAHTGERPFVCPECGKGFARMYALSTHIKYTHSDEKRFKCEVSASKNDIFALFASSMIFIAHSVFIYLCEYYIVH